MSNRASNDVLLRDFLDSDLADIAIIERDAQPSPWSRLAFESSMNAGHFCRALVVEKALVGYLVAQLVADELHLLNLALAPSWRGRGLGHDLMHELFNIAARHEVKRLFLEVRESNQAAQALYQKWGFNLIAVRKDYYSNSDAGARETARVFARDL